MPALSYPIARGLSPGTAVRTCLLDYVQTPSVSCTIACHMVPEAANRRVFPLKNAQMAPGSTPSARRFVPETVFRPLPLNNV